MRAKDRLKRQKESLRAVARSIQTFRGVRACIQDVSDFVFRHIRREKKKGQREMPPSLNGPAFSVANGSFYSFFFLLFWKEEEMTRFSCGKRDSKDEWFLPQSRVYELRQRERDQRELQVPFSPVLVMWLFFLRNGRRRRRRRETRRALMTSFIGADRLACNKQPTWVARPSISLPLQSRPTPTGPCLCPR